MIYKNKNQGTTVQQKDYSKTILLTSEDLKNQGNLLQVVTIPPRTRQRLHYHQTQTEVYYILEGEAEIHMNDEVIIAHPGDGFICEPNDRHYLWNKQDKEFRLVVFKIDFPQKDDTVWLEE